MAPGAAPRAPYRLRSPFTSWPKAQILSNGAYVAIVTNAGGPGILATDAMVSLPWIPMSVVQSVIPVSSALIM